MTAPLARDRTDTCGARSGQYSLPEDRLRLKPDSLAICASALFAGTFPIVTDWSEIAAVHPVEMPESSVSSTSKPPSR
ncbi:MAG: hypothetical protein EKK44_21840 [Methylobacterium sp.]|nr:MAG: hypothetical protein EKK44_21840 [Methylobacterium sp.]